MHQADSDQKAAAEQVVGMYHGRVAHRVAEANQSLALCRRWGMVLSRSRLMHAGGGAWLETALADARVPQQAVDMALDQWRSLERAAEQEQTLYKQVCRMVKTDEAMSRVTELPGYGPVRAATLLTHLDTPFRFKSRSALWKYVGIGLRRDKSGNMTAGQAAVGRTDRCRETRIRIPEFHRRHCRPKGAARYANEPGPDVCYAPTKSSWAHDRSPG